MSKTFRKYEPDQMLLLPATLQEWLPPDHLVYFLSNDAASADSAIWPALPKDFVPPSLSGSWKTV